MSKSLLSISKLSNVLQPKIPGYFVASTAPINVEGDIMAKHKQQVQALPQLSTQLEEIELNQLAELLYQRLTDSSRSDLDLVEVVISINGFSNSLAATKQRVEEIYQYINKDNCPQFQNQASNLMYIGYRWPSEPLMGDNTWWFEKTYYAIAALPILPRLILMFGAIGIVSSFFLPPLQSIFNTPLRIIFSAVVLFLTALFSFVASLVVLRLLVYFRDNYRATNYGVPDLVEFIRQLDKALVSKAKDEYTPQVSLIDKLVSLLVFKLKSQLQSGVITQQEEAILERICQQVVKGYCKDNCIETLTTENVKAISGTQVIKQEQIDEMLKLASQIIKEDTEDEFVNIKERASEILENKAKKFWQNKNRIKLSFIGHSMGAYVVTGAVRILSDVFDFNSVGTLGLSNKLPSSDIGNVFSLERLVLVAPDIPINTILSGRANFLRSSLRRFKEAYLFSNEGDLALRLASTVANYFSFPARTRESGYRLGNVAIKDSAGYGIINLNDIRQQGNYKLLSNLFVDSFNLRKSLANIQASFQKDVSQDTEAIANFFTYFDCTDYTDYLTISKGKTRRVLTLKQWKWEPRSSYYLRLIIAYALGIRDTHGGYFQGEFCQQAIYRLAFLGFGAFLDSFGQSNRLSALDEFSQKCSQNKIQVIISPERYEVDILQREPEYVRKQMLNAQNLSEK
jgi:hypothetical protein